MAGRTRTYQKNLEFIAKDIGEELIPFLSKEQMLKHMTPEDIVSALTPEEWLLGLTSEERRKIKQLLEGEDEKNQK